VKEFSEHEAKAFVRRVNYLYTELSTQYGRERAWEFILSFYKGAGSE
jgi:hypothetical protein